MSLNRWVFKWRLKVRMFRTVECQQVESSRWMDTTKLLVSSCIHSGVNAALQLSYRTLVDSQLIALMYVALSSTQMYRRLK